MAVRAGLDGLSDRNRRVLVCRYFLSMSVEETASALRLSAANVRVITHRGLRQLEGLLEGEASAGASRLATTVRVEEGS